ncbi:MAG: P-II family nitrogen regulator [Methanomassiliicoccales archaeon]|jgi:nitrogen regulatory protein PII
MIKVEAVIRPEKLGAVKTALTEVGVNGMTTYMVLGRGEQGGLEFTHRAGKYKVDLLEKIKIEVVVPDGKADAVVKAIMDSARTGEVGDGKIFLTRIEKVIKVRTGESAE